MERLLLRDRAGCTLQVPSSSTARSNEGPDAGADVAWSPQERRSASNSAAGSDTGRLENATLAAAGDEGGSAVSGSSGVGRGGVKASVEGRKVEGREGEKPARWAVPPDVRKVCQDFLLIASVVSFSYPFFSFIFSINCCHTGKVASSTCFLWMFSLPCRVERVSQSDPGPGLFRVVYRTPS